VIGEDADIAFPLPDDTSDRERLMRPTPEIERCSMLLDSWMCVGSGILTWRGSAFRKPVSARTSTTGPRVAGIGKGLGVAVD
jgi:hypothetical protein